MNASVEFLPGAHAVPARSGVVGPPDAFDRHSLIDPASLVRLQDGVLEVPGALELRHGGRLD
ncbi:MAG: hypothetical protein JOZ12_01055, partial [Sinobacteraceae bacterium]|nr:hypothetical protein [Nevskiaceae bacterium]